MRRVLGPALGLWLTACAASSPARCAAWAAGEACRLPALEVVSGADVTGAPSRVVMAVDARGALLVAVSYTLDGAERVGLFEETPAGLAARDWPGALDRVVDMPALATGPDGEAAVAVRVGADGATGDVLVATRDAAGAWQEPGRDAPISFPPRAYEPRVAFDATGALLVVVNQGAASRNGYGVGVSTAAFAGAPFVRPRDADDVLSLPMFFSNSPRPALAASGAGVITWYQSLGSSLLAFASTRSGPEAAFTHVSSADIVSLSETAVDSAGAPDPATSPDGTTAIAWGQGDGRGGIAVYLAIRRPDGSIERPGSLEDRLSLGDAVARDPSAAIADDGTVFVAWSERFAGSPEHVFVARLAPGAARDQLEVLMLSAPSASADSPALAVSARGEVAVSFVERDASGARIVLRRGGLDGLFAPGEVVAEGARVAAPVLAFGRSARRFALAWVDAAAVHVSAQDRP